MAKKFYITTAIDYVNAKPHVGHAFEKILADAIARWHKLKGEDVFFLTGVDENAQKNVQAAEKAGVPVKEFVDKNALFFIELCRKLEIEYDDFIRTTAKEHAVVVTKILKKIIDKGDIYKSKYEGYYCTGCEAFITEKELVDGKCPEHNKEPEFRKEEAYFFKLSKYQKKLLEIIPKYVVPETRKNEIIARVKEGLNDICISRKDAEWGIDFPGDKNYKVYVWIDALINYISGLKGNEKKYWPAELHVVGKGINWFHSVIWPALLLSAGYKLPKKLLVHGYLTLGGGKISKSIGNIIDPLELAGKYQADSIRYSLLRCSVFDDSEFSEEILIKRHNSELADKLGNLVSRVSALAEKYGVEKSKLKGLTAETRRDLKNNKCALFLGIGTENNSIRGGWTLRYLKREKKDVSLLTLKEKSDALQIECEKYLENYELDKALNLIFAFIDSCNEFIQFRTPWVIGRKWEEASDKEKKQILPELRKGTRQVLYELANAIKAIAILLWPFIPESCEKIAKQFGFALKYGELKKPYKVQKISKGEILFTKIEQEIKAKESKKEEKIEGIIKMSEMVSFNEWGKIELKAGKILKAEDIEGADKLYKLEVDLGSEKKTILAGIKQFYKKDELKNKLCIVFSNLEPRLMRGIKSEGMILAAVNADHSKVVLIAPEKDIELGSRIS